MPRIGPGPLVACGMLAAAGAMVWLTPSSQDRGSKTVRSRPRQEAGRTFPPFGHETARGIGGLPDRGSTAAHCAVFDPRSPMHTLWGYLPACRMKSQGTFRRDAAPCLVTVNTGKGGPMTIHQRAGRRPDAVQPAESRPMPAVPGVARRRPARPPAVRRPEPPRPPVKGTAGSRPAARRGTHGLA
jgi:hypothetical protein